MLGFSVKKANIVGLSGLENQSPSIKKMQSDAWPCPGLPKQLSDSCLQ